MTNVWILHRRGFASLVAGATEYNDRPRAHVALTDCVAAIPRDAGLIFICCDHPDAFRGVSNEVLSSFPLAEIRVVAGPWLRAAARTRQHWPTAWYVSEADALQYLDEVMSGQTQPHPRPATWTREERWLTENARR